MKYLRQKGEIPLHLESGHFYCVSSVSAHLSGTAHVLMESQAFQNRWAGRRRVCMSDPIWVHTGARLVCRHM